jgi:glutamyl/glutaminyl-tRNA synthetase
LGLNWDEGPSIGGPHGPYRQTERAPLYRDHLKRLIASGAAYPCFCNQKDWRPNARKPSPPGGDTVTRVDAAICPPKRSRNARRRTALCHAPQGAGEFRHRVQ